MTLTIDQQVALNGHLIGVYYPYTDVTDLHWFDAEHTMLNCTVAFTDPRLGTSPYTAMAEDITLHCPEIFARAINDEFGPIAEYVPPSEAP
ncbi:hypothetical protein LJR231_001566 [Phyllobacterium sp. LjRoot231]|uniref:hypothetical protein n=1 Tax=Phyllobacterium sp. LjRoot231 TaxID=3342289 RepID=UPI003ECE9D95